MAKLEVSATIHPLDARYLLVAVEDDTGAPVQLKPDNFRVRIWAATGLIPGSIGIDVPIAAVSLLSIEPEEPKYPYFYVLQLDDVPIGTGAPYDPLTTVSLYVFGPLVYGVVVDRDDSHGQAIACACCETPGSGGPSRHGK